MGTNAKIENPRIPISENCASFGVHLLAINDESQVVVESPQTEHHVVFVVVDIFRG